jgi:hypothetical protein
VEALLDDAPRIDDEVPIALLLHVHSSREQRMLETLARRIVFHRAHSNAHHEKSHCW